MVIQQRLLKFIMRTNWCLLAAASIVGFAATQLHFALGIAAGGLIVTLNFHLLYRNLKRSLTPPHLASHNVVLLKYYIRFILTCFIIFLLIAGGYVEPLGLVIGLSIVVASIMLGTIREFIKLIYKEAV
ncbi:MAG: ATP synthase subunit I [Desulfobacteraceae bacterium]|nr:ATP synthase subunit I [Desulfobacteraceae bacterium]